MLASLGTFFSISSLSCLVTLKGDRVIELTFPGALGQRLHLSTTI